MNKMTITLVTVFSLSFYPSFAHADFHQMSYGERYGRCVLSCLPLAVVMAPACLIIAAIDITISSAPPKPVPAETPIDSENKSGDDERP